MKQPSSRLARLRNISKYEIIAFVTGFALMAYELVASRILAPSIGSSTYVWTSVIGVIIAALSVGYALGGYLADKRVAPADIAWLLLAAAFGMMMTLVNADLVFKVIDTYIGDSRLQGLLASLFLFAPASFVLGMASPYLVRLHTLSLATAGRSVASLSALNAIGGIVGTFCVGFIFFGFIGSKETMVLVSLILVGTSWLIMPKYRLGLRSAASVAIVLLAVMQFAPQIKEGIVADIDTPSSRYQVIDTIREKKPVRILVMGPHGAQSGVYSNGSGELAFGYARHLAEIVEKAPKKDAILVLGGGAFTVPQYLANKYPSSKIDVVEIDPKLVGISKQYFNYVDHHNVEIITEDARTFLNANKKPYDIILVDAYSNLSIPFSLTTVEYAEKLKKSLQPTGVVAANVVGSNSADCAPLLTGLHASYKSAFSKHELYYPADKDLGVLQNIILVYANTSLSWLDTKQPSRETFSGDMRFTDNFAPVERVIQQCQSSL